jgi:hypothetical protein
MFAGDNCIFRFTGILSGPKRERIRGRWRERERERARAEEGEGEGDGEEEREEERERDRSKVVSKYCQVSGTRHDVLIC